MSWPAPLTVLQAAAIKEADKRIIVAILRILILHSRSTSMVDPEQ
jgi:hypothetical protein